MLDEYYSEFYDSDQPEPVYSPPWVEDGIDFERINTELIAVMSQCAPRRHMYEIDGRLVQIVKPAGIVSLSSIPTVEPCSIETLEVILSTDVKYYRVDYRNGTPTKIIIPVPQKIIKQLLKAKSYPGLPRLTGLVGGPVLRPDGTVFCGSGYDEKTGLYGYGLPMPWPASPPTTEELNRHLFDLYELMKNFPFKYSDGKLYGFAAWLAVVFTLLARYAIDGPVPLLLFTATVRGCGKTLAALIACLIGIGGYPEFNTSIGRGSDEEERKAITSLLMKKSNAVLLDNLRGELRSPILEALLTATNWSDRILGGNDVFRTMCTLVFIATANNLRIKGDLTRRVQLIELESTLTRPEERPESEFAIPNLLDFVKRNHLKYRFAALRLLESYCAAGRPAQRLAPWGSYESWSSLVRGCLVWLGLPDIAESRQAIEDDEEFFGSVIVNELRSITFEGQTPMTPSQIAEYANTPGAYPELHEALTMLSSSRRETHSARDVGRLLTLLRGRNHGGWVVDRPTTGTDGQRRNRLWTVRPA
jgi:hypothetical protein